MRSVRLRRSGPLFVTQGVRTMTCFKIIKGDMKGFEVKTVTFVILHTLRIRDLIRMEPSLEPGLWTH